MGDSEVEHPFFHEALAEKVHRFQAGVWVLAGALQFGYRFGELAGVHQRLAEFVAKLEIGRVVGDAFFCALDNGAVALFAEHFEFVRVGLGLGMGRVHICEPILERLDAPIQFTKFQIALLARDVGVAPAQQGICVGVKPDRIFEVAVCFFHRAIVGERHFKPLLVKTGETAGEIHVTLLGFPHRIDFADLLADLIRRADDLRTVFECDGLVFFTEQVAEIHTASALGDFLPLAFLQCCGSRGVLAFFVCVQIARGDLEDAVVNGDGLVVLADARIMSSELVHDFCVLRIRTDKRLQRKRRDLRESRFVGRLKQKLVRLRALRIVGERLLGEFHRHERIFFY